jgi:type IV secretory pathway TraG/TraD family ATPase VirD4
MGAGLGRDDRVFAGVVVGGGAVWLVLTLGAWLAFTVTGRRPANASLTAPLLALANSTDLGAAWGPGVPSPWVYWSCTLLVVVVAIVAVLAWRCPRTVALTKASVDLRGCASRREVQAGAGRATLSSRAATLRPEMNKPALMDLGFRLGTSRGVAVYATVEDSMVILGPPRSGKGIHLGIPMILDAPGPVLTTSTRPDNLAVTMCARARLGPVAVFDPQGLAHGIRSATRWSPIRGCEDPHVAMVRAKALTNGAAHGTTDANFWQASAEQAVRCLLHAAALGGCTSSDLYRWSLSASQAREAVVILSSHAGAADAWNEALEAVIAADPRQRDSVWAMVTIAFAFLADPKVLDAVSPGPGEQFDPHAFLTGNGTIYLLGTATGSAATAGLVGAFVEDVAEAARRTAARSTGSRLDPPLTLVLDEAANYPLPSLPSLMSDGGGTGICTAVILQSLAQARHVWGEHAASAIWDAAIVKVILGGGSNARDLQDLSTLIGQRDHTSTTTSRGRDGHVSRSTSISKVPILEPAQLRTLPFGTAVLLLRAARPIGLTLSPWTVRPDAAALTADRRLVEGDIHDAATA